MSKGKKTITIKRKTFKRRGGTIMSTPSRIQRSFRGNKKFVERGGDIYDGSFVNDNLVNGKITRFYSKIIDEGKFVNKRLTEGTRTYPDGTIEEGKFNNGSLIKGTRTYEDGKIEKGKFNGSLTEGTRTYPDGIIINVGAVDDDNHGRPY
jgi:hypothetical protein